ncbi:hypothetical protein MSAN_00442600 [Mycena sanguinolenta]|uniref:Uncharacterized protein n=1 Tax=Mycena sanguinolenta TaxID=230812 RepID=A0A8H6ZDY5_9AGAR|nr:hypothetical protein MSAN_00442600 [Mycena sanguinolenta]
MRAPRTEPMMMPTRAPTESAELAPTTAGGMADAEEEADKEEEVGEVNDDVGRDEAEAEGDEGVAEVEVGVVVAVAEVVVDVGVAEVDAGLERPPYVQSPSSGILGP